MRKDGIFTGGAAAVCLCSMEKKLIFLFPIQNRFAKSHLILLQLKLSLSQWIHFTCQNTLSWIYCGALMKLYCVKWLKIYFNNTLELKKKDYCTNMLKINICIVYIDNNMWINGIRVYLTLSK